jgi:hypothetical protein
MSLEKQLQLAIAKSMDESKPIGRGQAKSNASKTSNTMLSVIREKMSLFEGGGLRARERTFN